MHNQGKGNNRKNNLTEKTYPEAKHGSFYRLQRTDRDKEKNVSPEKTDNNCRIFPSKTKDLSSIECIFTSNKKRVERVTKVPNSYS